MLDCYVSTDNAEIGKLQAEYLTTIQPTGKYAMIGGALLATITVSFYIWDG